MGKVVGGRAVRAAAEVLGESETGVGTGWIESCKTHTERYIVQMNYLKCTWNTFIGLQRDPGKV